MVRTTEDRHASGSLPVVRTSLPVVAMPSVSGWGLQAPGIQLRLERLVEVSMPSVSGWGLQAALSRLFASPAAAQMLQQKLNEFRCPRCRAGVCKGCVAGPGCDLGRSMSVPPSSRSGSRLAAVSGQNLVDPPLTRAFTCANRGIGRTPAEALYRAYAVGPTSPCRPSISPQNSVSHDTRARTDGPDHRIPPALRDPIWGWPSDDPASQDRPGPTMNSRTDGTDHRGPAALVVPVVRTIPAARWTNYACQDQFPN